MNYVGHQSLIPSQTRESDSVAVSETTFRPPGDNRGNGWDGETRASDSMFQPPVAKQADETPRLSITELKRMRMNSKSMNRRSMKVFLCLILPILGIVLLVGVIGAVVASDVTQEEENLRELNALTFLNVCEEVNQTVEVGVEGISACFGEQAGFCNFGNAAPILELEDCEAIGLVCRCGRGADVQKVFRNREDNFNANGRLGLCIDADDTSDEECSDISDAPNFFSDSSDSSDSEDENGLEVIADFQAECVAEPDVIFYVCLNDEIQFACIDGVGEIVDCDDRKRRTNKCDGGIGIKRPFGLCVVDEDTSVDSNSDSDSTEVTDESDVDG